MRHNYSQLNDATVDRVNANGREYLVVPTIALKEKLYEYPEHGTVELLPRDSFAETVNAWSGVPVTVRHPDPDENGNQTAMQPDAYTTTVVGQVHDPEIVDETKLRVNAWIDVDRARSIGRLGQKVIDRLESGETLSVSPGYGTVDDGGGGRYNGTAYDKTQGTVVPDHVAIFPSDEFTARCSPEEGCAAPRLNHVTAGSGHETDSVMTPNQSDPNDDGSVSVGDETASRVGWKFLEMLGITANADPRADADSPDDGCGDDCACDDCAHGETTTNADADADADADDPPASDGPGDDPETEPEASESNSDDMTDTPTGNGDGSDPDAEAETTEEQTETTPEADATESGDGETIDQTILAEISALRDDMVTADDVEQLVANAMAEEGADDKRETIVNALDYDEEAAAQLEGAALDQTYELALEQQEREQTVTNYAGVPGPYDRTPEPTSADADGDDLPPAGGRSAYEQRKREQETGEN